MSPNLLNIPLLFFVYLTLTSGTENKVVPTTIYNENGEAIKTRSIGKKYVLVFYIDPDHIGQNKNLIKYINSLDINNNKMLDFYGIVNLKDAPLLTKSVAKGSIKKTLKGCNIDIFYDPGHLIKYSWKLGDVNNKFTVILINPQRDIIFYKAGNISNHDCNKLKKLVDSIKKSE